MNPDIPQLILTPLKPALIQGIAQKLPVLVRVQAPDAPSEAVRERKPYHLALVIDRSGSMHEEPLREAVRCVRHMIDRLAPTDLASLVVFDDKVKTLVATGPVGNRTAIYKALASIHEGGRTNLHGGWDAGAQGLLPKASEAAMARVILLSDGNANAGEHTDTDSIAGFCAEAAAAGVTTSTYGLGRQFNEELMVAMATRGQGNHYYGDTAADLMEPFTEEFDLIANLHSRQVRLALGAPEGIAISLLNDYRVEAREGFPLIRLPDIPYGAEAWAVVELAIPAGLAKDAGGLLLQAEVTAISPDGETVAYPKATLSLPAVSAAAWDAMVADSLVTARLAEVQVARYLLEAREAAERGDWDGIAEKLAELKAKFGEYPWVQEVLEEMAELANLREYQRFRKESMFSSGKMLNRLSSKEERLALAGEVLKASYLRRKKSQGKAQFGEGLAGKP